MAAYFSLFNLHAVLLFLWSYMAIQFSIWKSSKRYSLIFAHFYCQVNIVLSEFGRMFFLFLSLIFVFCLYFAGNLAAPLVAHVYCNFMGLPALYSQRSGMCVLCFLSSIVITPHSWLKLSKTAVLVGGPKY